MTVDKSSGRQLACKVIDIRNVKASFRALRTEAESRRTAARSDKVDFHREIQKIKMVGEERVGKAAKEDRKLELYTREAEVLKDLSHVRLYQHEAFLDILILYSPTSSVSRRFTRPPILCERFGLNLAVLFANSFSSYIIQDLVTAGDLLSYLQHNNGALPDTEVAVIVRQVCLAVQYLHEKNVVHRDIKPENVLITSMHAGAMIVLTDFGHARYIEQGAAPLKRMTTTVGTLEYQAPLVRWLLNVISKLTII